MTPFVKLLARLVGIVLLIAGIAGFFVGGNLMGVAVDPIHNIVHLLSGMLALGAANSYGGARLYLIVFGLIYGVVAVIGFTGGGDILGLFHTNHEGNLLHIAIAVLCLLTGFGSKKKV